MKEALRGKVSSNEEVIGAVQNWLKTQPKKIFVTELKNLNAGTSSLKLTGITLKSNISFVPVYLK
jgi:hypothetical protein